jgi:hypothetical protein
LLLETLAFPSADPARLFSRIVSFVAFLFRIVPDGLVCNCSILFGMYQRTDFGSDRRKQSLFDRCSLSGFSLKNVEKSATKEADKNCHP